MHFQIEVRSYSQVHECPDLTNKIETFRSLGAIALGPNANKQGTYFFMSLELGKNIRKKQIDFVNI